MSVVLHKCKILLLVVAPLVGVIIAIVMLWNRYVFLSDILLMLVLQLLFTVGVTIGYHRMLTHGSFKAGKAVRAFFVICGCMAIEGQPLAWVATHVKHHAHSDEDDDPHSPVKSFWHAHMGWLFDPKSFADPKVYCPHLLEDTFLVRVDAMYWVWVVLAFGIPAVIGGWSGFIWGGLVRVFITTHVTWSVNSICHTFGKRAFETTDESRNNWIIGLLGFGEGWHNNHHAFPTSAFHGLRWYQFDLSGMVIRSLERLGLVWDVQRVSDAVQEAHHLKGVTMHDSIAAVKADLWNYIESATEELNTMMNVLPPQKVAAVRYAHEQTVQRFCDIQRLMRRRRNIRKAILLKRQQEVADLFAEAKQRLRLLATA